MTHFYCFRSSPLWLGVALLCLFTTMATAQTIRYVKPVATGSGDGSSWANAASNLQRTIDRSAPDDQVWVAAGVYKPTRIPPGLDPTDERKKTFFFSNGVTLIGGFDGNETAPDQRDLTGPSSTTLSGDLGVPGSYSINAEDNVNLDIIGYDDNANTVVTIRGSSKTQLDGFIITGMSSGRNQQDGIGLLNDGSSQFNSQSTGSQPLIRNCMFNTVVGVAIQELGGSIASGSTYSNCFITSLTPLTSYHLGFGLICDVDNGGVCSPTFSNCKFSNLRSAIVFGVGGICLPTLINCSITGNSYGIVSSIRLKGKLDLKLAGCLIANTEFAAINYTQEQGGTGTGNFTLTNCTVVRNGRDESRDGGLFFVSGGGSFFSSLSIKNCVIFDNGVNSYRSLKSASVSYSIVPNEPGLAGKSNLVVDPLFFDGKLNGFQLLPTSPGVNGGDPNTNPKDLPATDLGGNPRIQGRIDMGAYERDVLPNRPPVALTHPDEAATAGIPMLSGGQEAYFFDPEDKPLTLTAMGLPANLSLIRNAAGSYAISGTPTTAGVSSVTLTAKDPDGLTATSTFQLVVDTAPVAFQLIAPTYNCQTGTFSFNTTGGDGSPIEFQAPGITAWSRNPNQFVDQGLRMANDVPLFTLLARQKGVVVNYSWNLKTACGRARMATSDVTDGLSVRVLGNPMAGETAQVAIGGVDGQALTLSLTDAAGKSISIEQIDHATTETRTIKLGSSAGVYLLRASTGTQSWTVRIVKP